MTSTGSDASSTGRPIESNNRASRVDDRSAVFVFVIFLFVIVSIIYSQTLAHNFVNFDDNDYVYDNPVVARGLTPGGLIWAFTHVHSDNWHPLTTLSHMLDCSLFGLRPWGHHLTNVFLHAATAIILFLAIREMTRAFWPSAFVAVFFAIHPLRVESVAWVAERKDVLSGVFFALTLWSYARYAGSNPLSARRYALVVCSFILGLLCKPTLVTMPFLLCLLDYWPLGRFREPPFRTQRLANFGRLVIEKIPLLAFSIASCVATVMAQQRTLGVDRLSLPYRIGNALISYVVYVRQTIWPVRLAVFYPYPAATHILPQALFAFVLLALISTAALLVRKSHPYVLIGWLWYLGMLAPMIGIVQVGPQAHADRYCYLPQIGLFVSAIFLVAAWALRSRPRQVAAVALGSTAILALMISAWTQATYWRDSESLWYHALDCTSGNYLARNSLGHFLFRKGQTSEAVNNYEKALAIKPHYAEAHNNLGIALRQKGRLDAAIAQYRQAIAANPELAAAHNDLANALQQKGELGEAIQQYEEALRLQPSSLSFQNNLALLLATAPDPLFRNGEWAVQLAEKINSASGGRDPLVLSTLAAAYAECGRFSDAINIAHSALNFATARGDGDMARAIQSDLRLYQSRTPLRIPSERPSGTPRPY